MKKTIERINCVSGIISGTSKVALVAMGVAFLASCNNGPTREELTAKVDSLSVQLVNTNKELDGFMGLFNEVTEGFRLINEAENRIEVQSGDVENGINGIREKVKYDLAFIQNKMNENRELIAELENKLKNSNYKSSQLNKAVQSLTAELAVKADEIKALQEELAAKNIRIQELDEAVASLNTIKDELTAKNFNKSQIIADQDSALNAAWYVVGSKKVLKEHRILTNTGLFKRGDVMEDTDVNKECFTQVDIRNINEISLGAKSAKVLTVHPEGSYTLVKGDDGLLILKIVDSNAFWSVTRYLVVKAG